MGDRNFFGCKHNRTSSDRNNSLLDRCPNSECNTKHCSRKRNLPENSEMMQKQTRKKSTSEEEDDELEFGKNFFGDDDDDVDDDGDDNDDDDDDSLSTIEEQDDDTSAFSNANLNQTFSETQAVQAISSLFRNANSDSQKTEIGIGYPFHGHGTNTSSNATSRGFVNSLDSNCHHHTQQVMYNGHVPASSHYVVSYGTVPSGDVPSGCDGTYGRVSNAPVNTGTGNVAVNRNMNQQEPNSVELSSTRHSLNNSRPTICDFGFNRTMCGNFGHSFPSLYSMPVLASETFCAVPGRTSLLSSTTKYHVTIGEIYRRISPPECLNASLLGGILRKAKSKDGGKTLRDSLKRVGLTLPAGRRKAATVTAWTALVEEEALHMAKDFAALSEKAFPVRQIADFICNRMVWQEDLRDCRTLIEHMRILIKELSDIVSGERAGTMTINQPNTFAGPAMQHGLAHFSLMTHGFGPLAFVAVFDTLIAMLDEMLKCCDRNEQHLNVPLSVISVTHIPSNRIAYNSNM